MTVIINQKKERLDRIKRRLEEYEKHKNDPYSFYKEEIEAVRNLKHFAPEDIKFLLSEIKRLQILMSFKE